MIKCSAPRRESITVIPANEKKIKLSAAIIDADEEAVLDHGDNIILWEQWVVIRHRDLIQPTGVHYQPSIALFPDTWEAEADAGRDVVDTRQEVDPAKAGNLEAGGL